MSFCTNVTDGSLVTFPVAPGFSLVVGSVFPTFYSGAYCAAGTSLFVALLDASSNATLNGTISQTNLDKVVSICVGNTV